MTDVVAEQAQALGGEMARALGATARVAGPTAFPDARLEDAVQRLKTASDPLLRVLDPQTRIDVRGEESA